MSAAIEMSLVFKDSQEAIVLTERDLISKSPVLVRSIETENPDWQTSECKVATPLQIPFSKSAGDFLFQHIRHYAAPDAENSKIEDYQEAAQKNMDELKEILELANFLECNSFMHCIGFVIAKKLEVSSMDQIAEYFGIMHDADERAEQFLKNAVTSAPTTNQNVTNAPSTNQDNQEKQDQDVQTDAVPEKKNIFEKFSKNVSRIFGNVSRIFSRKSR